MTIVNTTNLQDPTPGCTDGTPPDCPMLSRQSLSCDLNEVDLDTSKEGTFRLNGSPRQYTGVGTQLGVQTNYGLTGPRASLDYCPAAMSTDLEPIFRYAVANGAKFIEITRDIAGNPNCGTSLHYAEVALINSTKTNCQY